MLGLIKKGDNFDLLYLFSNALGKGCKSIIRHYIPGHSLFVNKLDDTQIQ